MPISYVDSDDFDALVSAPVRLALFDDTAPDYDGSNYASALFTRAAELASTIALSSMQQAGYDPAASTTDDMAKATALAVLVHLAYGRKQRAVPDSTAAMLAALPEAVRTGELPLTVESVSSVTEAVGGGVFTSQDDTTSSGGATIRVKRSPVMRDLGNDL